MGWPFYLEESDMSSTKDLYQDKIFPTTKYGDILVTDYVKGDNIKIKFLNSGFETKVTLSQIKRGTIKDPTVQRSVLYGLGFIDVNYATTKSLTIDGKVIKWMCPYYKKWCSILQRVLRSRKLGTGITICEEWRYLSKFIEWVDAQPNRDWENCEPDKDILFIGNKHYSPETVIFVEKRINIFVLNCGKSRGPYMLGVTYIEDSKINPYRAQINNPFSRKHEYIGLFPTELDAHLAWKAKKLKFAIQLTQDIVDGKVKEALLNYYSENSDLTNI